MATKRHVGRCDLHGKLLFASRKAARNAAKYAFPGERRNAYRCNELVDYWHFGSLNRNRREYQRIAEYERRKREERDRKRWGNDCA